MLPVLRYIQERKTHEKKIGECTTGFTMNGLKSRKETFNAIHTEGITLKKLMRGTNRLEESQMNFEKKKI